MLLYNENGDTFRGFVVQATNPGPEPPGTQLLGGFTNVPASSDVAIDGQDPNIEFVPCRDGDERLASVRKIFVIGRGIIMVS